MFMDRFNDDLLQRLRFDQKGKLNFSLIQDSLNLSEGVQILPTGFLSLDPVISYRFHQWSVQELDVEYKISTEDFEDYFNLIRGLHSEEGFLVEPFAVYVPMGQALSREKAIDVIVNTYEILRKVVEAKEKYGR